MSRCSRTRGGFEDTAIAYVDGVDWRPYVDDAAATGGDRTLPGRWVSNRATIAHFLKQLSKTLVENGVLRVSTE